MSHPLGLEPNQINPNIDENDVEEEEIELTDTVIVKGGDIGRVIEFDENEPSLHVSYRNGNYRWTFRDEVVAII